MTDRASYPVSDPHDTIPNRGDDLSGNAPSGSTGTAISGDRSRSHTLVIPVIPRRYPRFPTGALTDVTSSPRSDRELRKHPREKIVYSNSTRSCTGGGEEYNDSANHTNIGSEKGEQSAVERLWRNSFEKKKRAWLEDCDEKDLASVFSLALQSALVEYQPTMARADGRGRHDTGEVFGLEIAAWVERTLIDANTFGICCRFDVKEGPEGSNPGKNWTSYPPPGTDIKEYSQLVGRRASHAGSEAVMDAETSVYN